ncbi:MAG: hypothetical protein IJ684_05430 [Bacteroidales bacterium]|nr:hypothetical protein [Bacteroidales bacterium]
MRKFTACHLLLSCLCAAVCISLLSCQSHPLVDDTSPSHRGVYHWKTTFNPTKWERDWMQRHGVDRLYVKLFEVNAGYRFDADDWLLRPEATTRFLQPLPQEMEVVPVVYITVDAIRALDGGGVPAETQYASLVVERVWAMMEEHWGAPPHELQVDCDWTQSTRSTFFSFAHRLRAEVHKRGAELSGTVRLHQLKDDMIPFDRKLLMCYNTGRLQDPKTHNSILDYDDVRPYLRGLDTTLLRDYDMAWPAYGWSVRFDKKGHFLYLGEPRKGKHCRVEWGEPEEVLRVKNALPKMSGNTVILYHLDEVQLKHYSDEDIEAMYGPRPVAR